MCRVSFLRLPFFVGFLFVHVVADLEEFLHGGVFGLGEEVVNLAKVTEGTGYFYEDLERDQAFLFKAGEVAQRDTRLPRHLLASDSFLDAALAEVVGNLHGGLFRRGQHIALK